MTVHDRRLEKGGVTPGLSCDEQGVYLGGVCALVTRDPGDESAVYRARSADEISGLLAAAYGATADADRHHAVLRRVAGLMNTGQLGLAQITTLQLRLPNLPDETAVERLAKADVLLRFNPNHRGPGPGGGQFTSAGLSGATPSTRASTSEARSTSARSPRGKPSSGRAKLHLRDKAPGVAVLLPNARKIADPQSPTGSLMSPVADLADVARAGQAVGAKARLMLAEPKLKDHAGDVLYDDIRDHLAICGKFDYQRVCGPGMTIDRGQFRNVSNFNVGLFMQQAGFSKDEAIGIAGSYALTHSSNHTLFPPFLNQETKDWIGFGYDVGASQVYGKAIPFSLSDIVSLSWQLKDKL